MRDSSGQIVRQRINIRKQKAKIRRQYERKQEQENQYECPVYLCGTRFATEDALVDHYNAKHPDLVNLGIKLLKSKKARTEERQRKAEQKANRIVINNEPNEATKKARKERNQDNNGEEYKDNYQSDSESDIDSESASGDEEQGQRQVLDQAVGKYLDQANTDKKGYIFDQNGEGDADEDSYMEDLHQREAARVERKRLRETRRQ